MDLLSPKMATAKCLESLPSDVSEWGFDEVECLILTTFADDDGRDLKLLELLCTESSQASTVVLSAIEKVLQRKVGISEPILLPEDTSRLKWTIIEVIDKCRTVYKVGPAEHSRTQNLVDVR